MSRFLLIAVLLNSFGARKAVISTPNREVTKAGEEAFLQGGNAADIVPLFVSMIVQNFGSILRLLQ